MFHISENSATILTRAMFKPREGVRSLPIRERGGLFVARGSACNSQSSAAVPSESHTPQCPDRRGDEIRATPVPHGATGKTPDCPIFPKAPGSAPTPCQRINPMKLTEMSYFCQPPVERVFVQWRQLPVEIFPIWRLF
ncbi:hypothetical protein [Verminephrobacter eiseniae]|uniref:hypothetical protein n=1 Tax=Verminephrobacter eiseniae TaxID=364317 RepID=UPI0022384595|nr:hypothetical protein [Verminephrobacter eiseniae]